MISTAFVSRRARRAARPGSQPQLERLEDRLVPSYALTDLGIPAGYSGVTPYAMNNAGQIVAIASTQGHPLGEVELYSNGQWTPLAQAVTDNFFPVAINNNGEILGEVPASATTSLQLYLFVNGQFVPLNPPQGLVYANAPVGLDDAGDVFAVLANPITGARADDLYDSNLNAWNPNLLPSLPNGIAPLVLNITDKGTLLATEGTAGLTSYHVYVSTTNPASPWQDLGTPNAGQSLNAAALNDNGHVLALTASGQLFIFGNGQWTNIGTPNGFPDVRPTTFDNADQVLANASVSATSPSHPFLYSGGQWIDLNALAPAGSAVSFAAADTLNYNGQIVATGSNQHAYLLTPLPPGSPPPGGGGGGGGGSASPPVPFFQAVMTLYIDGIEKILHDSPAIDQSIQDNLPWAVFAGFNIGDFVLFAGEIAALHALQGGGNGA